MTSDIEAFIPMTAGKYAIITVSVVMPCVVMDDCEWCYGDTVTDCVHRVSQFKPTKEYPMVRIVIATEIKQ